MVKNALEACSPGETVTVGCHKVYDYVRFWVHNRKHIPQKIQLQIFQRSFSTKGSGRGLGTYSMKLLSENFLQGRVSFESTAKDGTIFMGMYPIDWCSSDSDA
jgi:signal transduction histidine kinase